MDRQRKKELREAYRERRPEMGVISLRREATRETFLGISQDIPADFNSIRMKLESGYHPNRRLLDLWKQYGRESFTFTVARTLEYDDPAADHTAELEALWEKCMAEDAKARKIWR